MSFRLGRDDGVTISLQAKTPGSDVTTQTVALDVDFDMALGQRRDAYERLLDDALAGDLRRFARQDGVEEAWRVVEPSPRPRRSAVHLSRRGSWGPTEANDIVGEHRWHIPGGDP